MGRVGQKKEKVNPYEKLKMWLKCRENTQNLLPAEKKCLEELVIFWQKTSGNRQRASWLYELLYAALGTKGEDAQYHDAKGDSKRPKHELMEAALCDAGALLFVDHAAAEAELKQCENFPAILIRPSFTSPKLLVLYIYMGKDIQTSRISRSSGFGYLVGLLVGISFVGGTPNTDILCRDGEIGKFWPRPLSKVIEPLRKTYDSAASELSKAASSGLEARYGKKPLSDTIATLSHVLQASSFHTANEMQQTGADMDVDNGDIDKLFIPPPPRSSSVAPTPSTDSSECETQHICKDSSLEYPESMTPGISVTPQGSPFRDWNSAEQTFAGDNCELFDPPFDRWE